MECIKQVVKKVSAINEETRIKEGIDRTFAFSKLDAAGITSNDLVLDLLEWANGIESLNAFMNMLDIDSIINIYSIWKSLKDELSEIEGAFDFPRTVVPLLDINGDVQYGLDTSDNSVYMVDMEADISEKICSDYRMMVSAIDKGIEL